MSDCEYATVFWMLVWIDGIGISVVKRLNYFIRDFLHLTLHTSIVIVNHKMGIHGLSL